MSENYEWEGKPQKKKMLFVYNPMSGKEQIRNKLSDIIQIFCEAGFSITIVATQQKDDAKNVVIEQGAQYDYVVCSGGDGTINEVATGLMHLEKRPVCGYIPAGTVNDFASSLRIPKIMRKAARLITEGNVYRCDMGGFNDKFFTYVAGFGAFTEVSYQTPQEWKNALGKTAYFVEGIKHVAEIKPHHMRIEYDGNVIEDDFILGLVSNSVSVAGYRAYEKKNIKMDDGLFEGLFIRDLKNLMQMQEALNSLLSKNLNAPEIFKFSGNRIHIISDDEMQWTLDGEEGGTYKEVMMQNYQQALPIICARKEQENIAKRPEKRRSSVLEEKIIDRLIDR